MREETEISDGDSAVRGTRERFYPFRHPFGITPDPPYESCPVNNISISPLLTNPTISGISALDSLNNGTAFDLWSMDIDVVKRSIENPCLHTCF